MAQLVSAAIVDFQPSEAPTGQQSLAFFTLETPYAAYNLAAGSNLRIGEIRTEIQHVTQRLSPIPSVRVLTVSVPQKKIRTKSSCCPNLIFFALSSGIGNTKFGRYLILLIHAVESVQHGRSQIDGIYNCQTSTRKVQLTNWIRETTSLREDPGISKHCTKILIQFTRIKESQLDTTLKKQLDTAAACAETNCSTFSKNFCYNFVSINSGYLDKLHEDFPAYDEEGNRPSGFFNHVVYLKDSFNHSIEILWSCFI